MSNSEDAALECQALLNIIWLFACLALCSNLKSFSWKGRHNPNDITTCQCPKGTVAEFCVSNWIIKRAPKVLPGRFSGLLKSPPKVPEKTSKRTPRADGTTLGVLFHIFLKENGRGLRPRPTREGGGFAATLPCGSTFCQKI